MSKTGNTIVDLSFEFAFAIIIFTELLEEKIKFLSVKQLLGSGTYIGANIRESQNAFIKNDFVYHIEHKK